MLTWNNRGKSAFCCPICGIDSCVHGFLPSMCCPLPVLHGSVCLTRSLGSRMETDLAPETPLPSSWAKLSPELADSNHIAKLCRFNRQRQNTHPSLSLLLEQCSSPLPLVHLPGKSWKSESQWQVSTDSNHEGETLTKDCQKSWVLLPFPSSSLQEEGNISSHLLASLNPQDCLFAYQILDAVAPWQQSSCSCWSTNYHCYRSIVRGKACSQRPSPPPPQAAFRPGAGTFLAESTARSQKSLSFHIYYHYGYVWPFQDISIKYVT